MKNWPLLIVAVGISLTILAVLRRNASSDSGEMRLPPPFSVQAQLNNLKGILAQFHLDCGRYPTTAEGLNAITKEPLDLKGKWKGPYTDRPVIQDDWGHSYWYAQTREGYVLASFGADGEPGGKGDDEDIAVSN